LINQIAFDLIGLTIGASKACFINNTQIAYSASQSGNEKNQRFVRRRQGGFFMLNGFDIRDMSGLEAATTQLPLIGFTVLWRLERNGSRSLLT
jgi:hypothetical protein